MGRRPETNKEKPENEKGEKRRTQPGPGAAGDYVGSGVVAVAANKTLRSEALRKTHREASPLSQRPAHDVLKAPPQAPSAHPAPSSVSSRGHILPAAARWRKGFGDGPYR